METGKIRMSEKEIEALYGIDYTSCKFAGRKYFRTPKFRNMYAQEWRAFKVA